METFDCLQTGTQFKEHLQGNLRVLASEASVAIHCQGEPSQQDWDEVITMFIPRHQWDAGEWQDDFSITEDDTNIWTFTRIGDTIA